MEEIPFHRILLFRHFERIPHFARNCWVGGFAVSVRQVPPKPRLFDVQSDAARFVLYLFARGINLKLNVQNPFKNIYLSAFLAMFELCTFSIP